MILLTYSPRLVDTKDAKDGLPIVKIYDFTFSRDIHDGDYEAIDRSRIEALPVQWMPPEVLKTIVNKQGKASFGQTTDRVCFYKNIYYDTISPRVLFVTNYCGVSYSCFGIKN
jgi:hypothetical protein